jgi:hypothetical protein
MIWILLEWSHSIANHERPRRRWDNIARRFGHDLLGAISETEQMSKRIM